MSSSVLPTGTLLGRVWAVTIASPDQTGADVAAPRYTGLRTRFHVERSLRPEPNKATVTLTNLSAATRALMKVVASKTQPPMKLILEAGYQGNAQIVMLGNVEHIGHAREGADWNSHFEVSDGGAAWAGATTSCSFGPGTPISVVIQKLASDLGVNPGNLTTALAAGGPGIRSYLQGFSAHGLASRHLSRVLTAAGLEWSIQDGALQILKPGATTQTQAYLLNARTGLIGSPELGEQDPQHGAFLKVKTLLLPSLRPGNAVQLDAVDTKGLFRIQRCVHVGDSMGPDWHSELEVTRLGS